MFFFNPELLLISGVDEFNPADPRGWVWITNPLEIAIIFSMAFIGMMAFSCFTQGYYVARMNVFERMFFLTIVPFMFLPKIMESYFDLPSHYLSYGIGIGIYALLYLFQKAKLRANKASKFEVEMNHEN